MLSGVIGFHPPCDPSSRSCPGSEASGHPGQGAGSNGVDTDAVAGDFHGGDHREGGDACLGRPVVGLTDIPEDA